MNPDKWMKIALAEMGQKEIPGDEDNPRIKEYLQTVFNDLHDQKDETAWCSAFTSWVMIQAGLTSTLSPAARSWIGWGKSLDAPRYGAICIFRRGKEAWQGHVGFCMKELSGEIELLGGNQGNKVSIAKYKKADLLSIRWPE